MSNQTGALGRGFRMRVEGLRAIEAIEAQVRQLGVDYMVGAGAVDDPAARLEEIRMALDEAEELLVGVSEQAFTDEVQAEMARARLEGVQPGLLSATVVDRLEAADDRDRARAQLRDGMAGKASLRAIGARR
jgi:hypothetical protein